MADTNVGIKKSWSLVDFVKSHGGKLAFAPNMVNKTTGETFDTCVLPDYPSAGNSTFVGFSSNLGALSMGEIARMKNDLQVVELETGSYKICKKGTNAWQEIDLL